MESLEASAIENKVPESKLLELMAGTSDLEEEQKNV